MSRIPKPPIFDPLAIDPATQADPDLFNEPSYLGTGFPAPAGVPVKPPIGYCNWLWYMSLAYGRYLAQRGIADWDTNETDYDTYDIVRDVNGKIYQLFGTATPGTAPASDLTNWVLFHRPPQGTVDDTIIDPMAVWRNRKGFGITGKDHWGFDAGHILNFRENWTDGGAATRTATAAKAHWFGPWSTGIDNSGGLAGTGISLPGPYATDLTTRKWGSLLALNAFGQSVDAVSILETTRPIIKMSGASLVIDVGFSVNGASGPQNDTYISFGLGDGTLAANRSMGTTDFVLAHGSWIEGVGGANWAGYSKPNGGVSSSNNGPAVTRDVPHRWRCYVVGTSDSDDSVARVYHLIDGSVIATHTVSLLNQVLSPFVRMYAHSGEVCELNLSHMLIQARTELGDVLI